jgi:hypothetical protein
MDRYSHINLFDERAALDVLPKVLTDSGKGSEKNIAVAQKTGTDNLPIEPIGKAVEKTVTKSAVKLSQSLPKTAYLNRHSMSEIDIN